MLDAETGKGKQVEDPKRKEQSKEAVSKGKFEEKKTRSTSQQPAREEKRRVTKSYRFRRYKQIRTIKPRKKRLMLMSGALTKFKKRVTRLDKKKNYKVQSHQFRTGGRLNSKSGKRKQVANRLLNDGQKLAKPDARQGQDEAPEQYAIDSIGDKAEKVGEIALDEVKRIVKDKLQKEEPSSPTESVITKETEIEEEPTLEKKPKSSGNKRGADHSNPKKAPASKDGAAQAESGHYPVVPRSSGTKLQTLESTLGEDETQGIAVAQHTLQTISNKIGNTSSDEEDNVLGNRYVARSGNKLASKSGDIKTSDTESLDDELYPEPEQSAYEFHPEQEPNHNQLPDQQPPHDELSTSPQDLSYQSFTEPEHQAGGRVLTKDEMQQVGDKAKYRTTTSGKGNPQKGPSVTAEKTATSSAQESGLSGLQVRGGNGGGLQVGGKVGLNTWQNSPVVSSLQNQLPGLAGAQSGATVQAFANYGQAMAVQGGAAAGAVSGVATGGIGFAVQAGVQVGQKVIDQIKEAIQSAATRVKTSTKTWGAGTAILLFPLLLALAISGAIRGGGSATNVGLSADVLALMPQITEACQQNGIPEYTALVAAVIMQESGGNVDLVNGDVMQCAEGMGYPVGTPVPVEESINFGTRLLANLLTQAGAQGPTDLSHISLALQSYNFGGGYLTWATSHYGGYSKENALEYSQMQAAAMGWSGYGDPQYVDHVLRYYQVTGGGMGDRSAIANGFFAYPFPGHTWATYAGHEGIDISFSGIEGQPVYAAAAGTVSFVQTGYGNMQGSSGLASYGNCAFINHGNGWESRYAHMSSVVVQQGEYVQEGQLLGYVGNTGNSYGAHLHLALYYNGSPSSGGVIYAEQAWPQLQG